MVLRLFKFVIRTCIFLVVLGGLGFVITGAYKYYSKSDLFIFKDVKVVGNEQLSKADIIKLLQVEYGVKILEVPIEDYEEKLSRHPLIHSVSIGRRYPSKIKIKIEEKDAVALLMRKSVTMKSKWYGLDAKGKIIPNYHPQKLDLPIIEWSGLKKGKSLKKLADFLNYSQAHYPDIYNSISQIKMDQRDQFSLYSRDFNHRLIVSMDMKPENTLSFWELLWEKYHKDFEKEKVIDLTVRGCAYVS